MTMTDHRLGQFGITVGYDVDQAILVVQGDVDMLTAPTLGAMLGVLVDQDHPNVVLDLAALGFMDAAGLAVIADTSARLAQSGRVLTMRAAPRQTRRILEITGLDDLVRLEEAFNANGTALGAEQRSGDHSVAVFAKPADLAADLAKVGSRTTNELIDAALRLVTVLAGATVEGADGVSVTLERGGRLKTVASTNETIQLMDDHQYETGEGPCLAAAAEGHWFHSESLADESRWPSFVPRAIEEGIASILSTPLMTSERPIGALNIYSNSERAFGPREQELAALFASQASGILLDAGADVSDEQLGKRILDGLLVRETIARAEGMLMARDQLTAEHAAAALYRSARTARVAVALHAAEIVASTSSDVGANR